MDQDRTVNKIMFELKQLDAINMEMVDEVRKRLKWCYGIGYDEGRLKEHKGHSRKIGQYKNGKKIREFSSVMEAERILKISQRTLFKSLNNENKRTRDDYYFRYMDEDKNHDKYKTKLSIA